LRLFSFGGYGLALAALALVVFGAIECPPKYLDSMAKEDGNCFQYLLHVVLLFGENSEKELSLIVGLKR